MGIEGSIWEADFAPVRFARSFPEPPTAGVELTRSASASACRRHSLPGHATLRANITHQFQIRSWTLRNRATTGCKRRQEISGLTGFQL